MKHKRLLIIALICTLLITLSSCGLINRFTCEHEYVFVEEIPADCTHTDRTVEECTKCGYKKKTAHGSALGHDFIYDNKEPTCTEDGYKKTTCSRCDYSKNEVIPGGHNIVDTIVKDEESYILHKCSRCGEETKTPLAGGISSTYGFDDLSRFDKAGLQSFYLELVNACSEFSASTKDIPAKAMTYKDQHGVEHTENYYIIAELSPKSNGITAAEAVSVWKNLINDNPQFYWLSNAVLYDNDARTFTLCVWDEYAKYSARKPLDESIDKMVVECGAKIGSETDPAKKAKIIHDYIAKKTTYDFLSDGKTASSEVKAHNLTGVSYYGRGVCEAYAEAYQYLCTTFGVTCINVSGTGITSTGSGPHEWNYIQVGGKWYGVDVTWDDSNDKSLSHQYFGASQSFTTSHIAQSSEVLGMDYLYLLPSLNNINLVVL